MFLQLQNSTKNVNTFGKPTKPCEVFMCLSMYSECWLENDQL